MTRVRLNADVGEGGDDAALYPWLDEANIACGGHAGDERSMRTALDRCAAHGVAPGAHPGFPDRATFGRVLPAAFDAAQVGEALVRQVAALARAADALHLPLAHVKLHGALYHRCALDADLAVALATRLRDACGGLPTVWLAGSPGWSRLAAAGFAVRAEGFIDRGYRTDGTLVPRGEPGDLITDPALAAAQAERLARGGRCDTLCVHSDSPGAVAILREARLRLRS